MKPEPSFGELLAGCRRTAFKLEFRDQYMVDGPGYLAWQAGDLDQAGSRSAGGG